MTVMSHQPTRSLAMPPVTIAAIMAAIRADLAAHIARHGPAAALLALDRILAALRQSAPEPGLKSLPPAPAPPPPGSRS